MNCSSAKHPGVSPSRFRFPFPGLAALLLGLIGLIGLPPVHAQGTLTIGSKRFTESYILGEILRQQADSTGAVTATHKQGLGNTGIVFAALEHGDIDVYPEYTGTISQELLKSTRPLSTSEMNHELSSRGLQVGVPLGFNDTYALAMRHEEAEKLEIKSISDLQKHPNLVVGLDQEFLSRADGWPGLKKAYNLPFQNPEGLDHGLLYEAMASGKVDVIDIYSTDSKIEKYHLVTLKDDRHYFPAYDAVLLYRKSVPTTVPKAWAAIERLKGTISAPKMIEMNAAVELSGKTPEAVARQFLSALVSGGKVGQPADAGAGTSSEAGQGFFRRTFGGDFWTLTRQHLFLVFASLAAATLIAVPLGIIAARTRSTAQPILATTGVIQTIPSLALLVFLIPLLGIGAPPALAALFLYSLLPIVRNTYTGLTDIPVALRESAEALGLSSSARLLQIELPLASRAILAGIKTSAVINVGTATIAAFIGAGGYGDRIVSGLAVNRNDVMLSGAVPAALLAILVQLLFDLFDRVVVPAGLRPSRRN